ncbi:MAG: hypothetical protein V1831_04435 [Candidatus Woesearchaeota archaeon]
MKMNLVNKINEFGSNVKHNLKQHGVKYALITTMGGAMVLSGCGYSQEEVNKLLEEQQQKTEQQQRDQYINTELAKNTGDIANLTIEVKGNTASISGLNTKIDDQTATFNTKIGEVKTEIGTQTTVLQQSIDNALKQYTDEQGQKDSGWIYRPGDGRHYDDPQYGSDRRVNELIRATRYSFPKSLIEDMEDWPGFEDAFPHVKSKLTNGRTSDGELKSGTAVHVDEPNGKSKIYKTNGTSPTYTISVWKVENFLRDYFGSNIYDLSRVTIHASEPCWK